MAVSIWVVSMALVMWAMCYICISMFVYIYIYVYMYAFFEDI